MHQTELESDWELARRQLPPQKIAPLGEHRVLTIQGVTPLDDYWVRVRLSKAGV